eukprot:2352409-Rhodomonas_salina.2
MSRSPSSPLSPSVAVTVTRSSDRRTWRGSTKAVVPPWPPPSRRGGRQRSEGATRVPWYPGTRLLLTSDSHWQQVVLVHTQVLPNFKSKASPWALRYAP